jgi:ADP-heptose:LPS heptosyltransferase
LTDRRRTILVIDLLGGLGDLLLVLPAIHALAEAHQVPVHVLTHAPGAELLAADPTVASVVAAVRHQEAEAVGEALRRLRPDLVVSTTRHSGIPDLVAATGCRAVTDLWRRPPPDERVDERYLRILAEEGVIRRDAPYDPDVRLTLAERVSGASAVREAVGGDDRAPVVLLPNAGMAVKQWPTERWVALADSVTALGIPVLTCAEAPTPCLPGVAALPATSLRGLAARFATVGRLGGVVVGADTGPLRLAVAARARAVALFGPTVHERYGLDQERSVNLQGLPGCPHRDPLAITEQPCWWTAECPLSTEGPACMADLDVDVVRRGVLAMLRRPEDYPAPPMGADHDEARATRRGPVLVGEDSRKDQWT